MSESEFRAELLKELSLLRDEVKFTGDALNNVIKMLLTPKVGGPVASVRIAPSPGAGGQR